MWRPLEAGGTLKAYESPTSKVDEKTLLQVMTNPNRLLDIDVKP